MTREAELYFGVVLSRIVSARQEGVHVQRVQETAPAFVLDDDVVVVVKYSTHRISPWQFTFTERHRSEISSLASCYPAVYAAFVCKNDGVALLSYSELLEVLGNRVGTGSVGVSRQRNKLYDVSGSGGRLAHKVSHARFPRDVLAKLKGDKTK